MLEHVLLAAARQRAQRIERGAVQNGLAGRRRNDHGSARLGLLRRFRMRLFVPKPLREHAV
jgi:hypothetical protein